MARVRKRSWKNKDGDQTTVWVFDWADERGKRHRKQFETKREADAYRIKIEGQLQIGTFRSKALNVTVKDLSVDYLVHCKDRVARDERMTERNYRTYKGHFKNHILNPNHNLADIKLGHLTSARVNEFRDNLRSQGTTIPTTRRILATLRSALEFAKNKDLIAFNPAMGIRVIGPRDEGSKKIIPPLKEDVQQLSEAADEDFRTMFLFAATTGIRASELYALRWKHIDFDAGEVNIVVRVDAYGNEGPPKSVAGVRTIPIGASMLKMLRSWRVRSKLSHQSDLVFPNQRGRYISHNNMSKRHFKPLFEKLEKAFEDRPNELPKPPNRFSWHALRHFAISCWIEAGLKPKTIQTFAGHSSLQITMDRYGHLFPSEDHGEAMEEIAKGILNGII